MPQVASAHKPWPTLLNGGYISPARSCSSCRGCYTYRTTKSKNLFSKSHCSISRQFHACYESNVCTFYVQPVWVIVQGISGERSKVLHWQTVAFNCTFLSSNRTDRTPLATWSISNVAFGNQHTDLTFSTKGSFRFWIE